MSVKIFISYSSKDKEKMEILYNALLSTKDKFSPIAVEKKYSHNSSLSEKVSTDIASSSFFIPILTHSSTNNQWVNQEIGFSYAKGKNVLPIVETNIIPRLKGFINNQIDLSFNYKNNRFFRKIGLNNFEKCIRKLVSYLENIVVNDFKSQINPQALKQGENYLTTVWFKGYVKNGFFDNYVKHLDSSWYRFNWDPSTLKDLNPRTAGELHGNVDETRKYKWDTMGWPLGRYNVHVRVYDHPAPGKEDRIIVSEEIHSFSIIE